MDSKINCSFAQIFDLLIDIKNLLISISHRLLTQYIFTIISAKNEDEGICTIRANSGSLEITYTVPLNLVGGSQVLEADLRLFRSNREVSLRHLFVNTIPTDLIWFIPKTQNRRLRKTFQLQYLGSMPCLRTQTVVYVIATPPPPHTHTHTNPNPNLFLPSKKSS